MRTTSLGVLMLIGIVAGCDVSVNVGGQGEGGDAAAPAAEPAEGGATGGGTSIEIPGLGIDIKGEGGKWNVKAPGTDVSVDGLNDVDVKAPGTDVRYKDGQVDVNAPGTSVEVK
ncbi:MAG: hypothetical protein AAGB00_06445 [Planctomycetota bacterium]